MQEIERLIYKTPNELDFYTLNYATNDLGTDEISTSAWASSNPSMTVNSPAPSKTDTTTTVWIGGGTISSNKYFATNTVDTLAARQFVDSIAVLVQQYNFIATVIVRKAVASVEDFTLDWTPRLENDTVVHSAWASSDPALLLNAFPPSINSAGTETTVWISGGVVGMSYIVTNTITTSDGRILENSFRVIIPANIIC